MLGIYTLPPPEWQIPPAKPRDTYPIYTGRIIYEQMSISNLNKVPVHMHRDRALRGFVAPNVPVPPEEITTLLLIEGPAVFNWGVESEWECIEGIIHADERDVYQHLYDADKVCVVRHYQLVGNSWVIYDTQFDQFMQGNENEQASGDIPANQLRVYENRVCKHGILYDEQWKYQRLEEARWGVRQETSDFALSILLVGMVSPNPEDHIAKLEAGARVASIPGGGNVRVERVGDSRIPDQLESEYDKLEAAYFRGCYLYDTANQPERPVGLDLQLRLEPQTAFVDKLRTQIREVYAMLDYTSEIKFAPLETKTVADKQLASSTIIELVTNGLMDKGKAMREISLLFPD